MIHPAQGPGSPQRPHIPGAADGVELALSLETAKTLNARLVFTEAHFGHSALCSPVMLRMSCSKCSPQASQVYS
jgi:hypothetical protein